LQPDSQHAADSPAPHPFDLRHGVDTSGLLYADRLLSGHAHDQHSEGYYATAPSLFRGVLARWQETLPAAGLTIEDYTLLDLGCGKGRVLLIAAEFPFRAVLGVELHPGLARIARRNVRRWLRADRSCRNVTVLTGDALDVPLPDGPPDCPTVLFVFNAFSAEIVRALMRRLHAAAQHRTAPIDLLYIHPDQDSIVRNTPGVEVLADEDFSFSEEDAGADVFGVNVDRCAIYRLPRQAAP
jgi:SAM-dependent methyltransferase